MFEKITLPFKLWMKNKEISLASATLALNQLEEAKKISEVGLLARPEDDTGWTITGTSGLGETLTSNDALSPEKLDISREQARKFYRFNPHGRAVIRSLCKFTIGRGVTFAMKFKKEVSDAHLNLYVDYWEAFVKKEKFLRKQKEFVRRYTRDGEVFLRFFLDTDGMVRIRFMEPERVKNPPKYGAGMIGGKPVRGNLSYGIETAKNDIEKIFFYYYMTGEDMNSWIRVPAKDVIHKKLSADSNCKRGFPYLEPILYELKTYNDWLKDRVILNKIRTAVALVKEIPSGVGPSATVKSMRDATRSQATGVESSKTQLFRPGTTLTARGVVYKFLSPDLDARDSAQDGRNILLSIAAGAGLPEYMVTGDASNANYSSSMVAESPAVREFEDLQDDMRDAFIEIFDRVIDAGLDSGELKEPRPEAELVFPSLISRDVKKEADAFVAYHQEKVLSLKTIRGRIGANHDVEEENLEKEPEPEIMPGMPGGAKPGAPVAKPKPKPKPAANEEVTEEE